jgi:hypothetical protein
MHPVDLDQFRAKRNGDLRPAEPKRAPRHKAGEWFLKGPIPGEWLHRAAKLPARSLHVALAVWYLAGVGKRRQVKITWGVFAKFGVSPDAGRRGLTALERAGLVAVDRSPGRCPVVTILEPAYGNPARNDPQSMRNPPGTRG